MDSGRRQNTMLYLALYRSASAANNTPEKMLQRLLW